MKSTELLSFKGYYGSMSVSLEDECLHGRIEFVSDLVTYEAATVPKLKKAFEAAVDDYLATCAEVGKDPLRSCSGTFNVRIGPDLHMAALVASKQADTSLNDFIRQAISDKVAQPPHAATFQRQSCYAAERDESAIPQTKSMKSARTAARSQPLYSAASGKPRHG